MEWRGHRQPEGKEVTEMPDLAAVDGAEVQLSTAEVALMWRTDEVLTLSFATDHAFLLVDLWKDDLAELARFLSWAADAIENGD